MPLITVVGVLIVVGLLLFLVMKIPMDADIKQIIKWLVIVVVILWIINLFLPGLANIHVGR